MIGLGDSFCGDYLPSMMLVPMGEKTYRTVRWGSDMQIWMTEHRDFLDYFLNQIGKIV